MGSVGDCFDNAMCESFFASLECELLWQNSFRSRLEARLAIFDFSELPRSKLRSSKRQNTTTGKTKQASRNQPAEIEGWCNTHRRHSGLDYMSPLAYEKRYGLAS